MKKKVEITIEEEQYKRLKEMPKSYNFSAAIRKNFDALLKDKNTLITYKDIENYLNLINKQQKEQ